ncbi:very short patch repair endonuclease [Roseovarius sp. THAF9]|uniref:very short patch repair endonuclease n=1 Tax=Roseovarius sp. THAF9 TaxID=2587847 RepID=UPI002674849D|nr:very short patch repair endonuclease [Roseovarius sp. THAF9]
MSTTVRSRMMAGIKGKDTKPERLIRSALHCRGFRFRLHRNDLPGKPDLVFPKWEAVIFVHGCFWHGHDCHLFRWPKTRTEFWKDKIGSNIQRDSRQIDQLHECGWRVGIVWECALKGRYRQPVERIAEICTLWLESEETKMQVAGNEARATD